MKTTTSITDKDIKTRHRAMWASGDYPAVATEVIAGLGPTLAVYRAISDDPEATRALDSALAALADGALEDGVMEWEYLLATAVVAKSEK